MAFLEPQRADAIELIHGLRNFGGQVPPVVIQDPLYLDQTPESVRVVTDATGKDWTIDPVCPEWPPESIRFNTDESGMVTAISAFIHRKIGVRTFWVATDVIFSESGLPTVVESEQVDGITVSNRVTQPKTARTLEALFEKFFPKPAAVTD